MTDLIVQQIGKAGHITLNRPPALNALTWDMCLAIEATQDDLPCETDGCSPLRIVNVDVLPVIRTKIYGNCLMDRSFPVYDYLVIRVVKYNFVTSIVVCEICVIGF